MTQGLRYTIEEMQKYAKEKGGKCLSAKYDGINGKLKWKCENGHEWEATPADLFYFEHWCPDCASNAQKKIRLDRLNKFAMERGGKCLSEKYINFDTKMKWRCAEGHIWEATINKVVKENRWCLICNGKEARAAKLIEMQDVARARGGKCLTEEYVYAGHKVKWQCSKGHIWETTPGSVLWHNSWCPVCGHSSEGHGGLTLKDMQSLAEQRGGKCLSDKYISVGQNLKWQCSRGHIFQATPEVIASKLLKNWCPICKGKVFRSRLKTIDKIQKLAKAKGGMCISEHFIGGGGDFKLQCKEGHIFDANYSQLKKKYWCPYCKVKQFINLEKNKDIKFK